MREESRFITCTNISRQRTNRTPHVAGVVAFLRAALSRPLLALIYFLVVFAPVLAYPVSERESRSHTSAYSLLICGAHYHLFLSPLCRVSPKAFVGTHTIPQGQHVDEQMTAVCAEIGPCSVLSLHVARPTVLGFLQQQSCCRSCATTFYYTAARFMLSCWFGISPPS